MAPRLTSSRFVGRAEPLAELEHTWLETVDGHPALVLLAGESGVGKSRLIAEFSARLGSKDGESLILRGEGVEQGDAELPYAPLLGALRSLVRDAHPCLEKLSPGSRAQLATLLPSLGVAASDSETGAGSGQMRLFEAMLELIDLLTATAPTLLVLEDLHWADRSTRTFLEFLARGMRDSRLMLLLSYRSDELHRRHPLRPLIAGLERLALTRRLELSPFSREELGEALGDILGEAPDPAVIERLYRRGEGNALYTEELLAAGLDGRGAAPQSLSDAFMFRVEQLAPEAQRVVRAVAAARMVTDETLCAVTGLTREQLNEALRSALTEQVLIACEDCRYAFRHALLREVVIDDLLPGERVDLHLALARALEKESDSTDRGALEQVTEVAAHYAAAGEQRDALRTTVQAARAARASHANGEAAELFDRALELWERVPDAPAVAATTHVELLTQAAGAHSMARDRSRAEVMLEQALTELPGAGQEIARADLLGRLARIQWGLNRGEVAIATAQEALSLLPADAVADDVRVRILAWLARTQVLRGRFRDALRDGERAREAAVRAGSRQAEGELLNTLGMAYVSSGHAEQGVALLQGAIDIATERDDPDSAGYAYTNLADVLDIWGRTREALAVAEVGLAQLPRYLGATVDWLKLTLSQMNFELGDWEAARRFFREADGVLVGRQLIFRLLRDAEQALAEGDDVRVAAALEEAGGLVASSSEPQWIALLGSLQGEALRRRGELRAAREAVARQLDRLEVCTDDVMRIVKLSAIGLRVESDLAQRGRDLRDAQLTKDALARARLHLRRIQAAAPASGPVEAAWLASSRAEMERARGHSQSGLWTDAAAAWDAIERPYLAALARWRAAEAAAESGERKLASEQLVMALKTVRKLGSHWLEAELLGLAERARIETEPETPEPMAASADSRDSHDDPGDPFDLTPRERQVLALIAEGATNREIGSALYMAEKTASVHVSRILSKLGVRSRTQAAAVAHRLDLA